MTKSLPKLALPKDSGKKQRKGSMELLLQFLFSLKKKIHPYSKKTTLTTDYSIRVRSSYNAHEFFYFENSKTQKDD